MDLTALEGMGLSHAEAKVYVALLTQGPSATGSIITHTKMQSSTVYHTLGALLEKGVVSYILRGKIKYFHAEKPEIFLSVWQDKKQKFDEFLPELKQKEKRGFEVRSAKMYEGMKGLRAAYDDVIHTMKPGQLYYFIQLPKEQFHQKNVKLFYRSYHMRRASKGIEVRGLSYFGTEEDIREVYNGIRHTTIRFTDEIGPTSLVIYGNKVMTIDLSEEPVIFVMESKTVAGSYKKFFEDQWKKAKKVADIT